jgi:hypothetical protein
MSRQNRGYNGARGASAASESRINSRINNLYKQLNGRKIIPPADPPAFVERPWNSYTFETTEVTTATLERNVITSNSIDTQIKGKLGLSGPVSFKVQKALVWGTSGGPAFVVPDIEVNFYEILSNEQTVATVRSLQRDKGTLQTPARAGYEYPVSDEKEIITSSELSALICSAIATDVGTHVTFRVHILWKSY